FAHRADRTAERQFAIATKEQALVDFAAHRCGQFQIDAELPDTADAIAQTALRQAIHALRAAARIGLCAALQLFFRGEILAQPRRGNRTRWQTGHTDELDE